jgi:hypothetical protein
MIERGGALRALTHLYWLSLGSVVRMLRMEAMVGAKIES